MSVAPTQESISIRLNESGLSTVSGLLDLPASPTGAPILLAHGAGVPMRSDFMQAIALGLAAGGHPVLRFNYPYAERMELQGTRRPPDRKPALFAAHRAAAAILAERFPDQRPIFAGKSMGGRIASMLAAEGDETSHLIFFGYPLHPPGKPEKQRSEHFPALAQPALFLQGDRDALCDLELLGPALETYGGRTTLETLQGADHDFAVPRKSGQSRDEVLAELVRLSLAWLQN